MTTIQVAQQTITPEEIIPLLSDYQMLAKFKREVLIDQAIQSISFTPSEKAEIVQQFYQQQGINSDSERDLWLKKYGMNWEQIKKIAVRQFKIQKFKQMTWGDKLGAYFIHRKKQLDQVVFSLIRTSKLELAQELYFRLQANEQSFVELAQQYSQGSESLVGGFVGPIELGNLPSVLAEVLSQFQPKQIYPVSDGKWQMIVRLEKVIPARLDQSMVQKLLNELFELWLIRQLSFNG
ncbi:MAG: peptidylprolyl isomerase [Cyanobacteria bacterium P01_A01_bin.83]